MNKTPAVISFVLILGLAASVTANTLTVATVHRDGVIEFEGGFKIHLTGIVLPDPRTSVGFMAFDFTKRRLEGRLVAVFTWTTDNTAAGVVYDDDGVAYAKIMSGKGLSIDFAAVLLEKGYARVDEAHLPEGYEHYRALEVGARHQKLGIWKDSD